MKYRHRRTVIAEKGNFGDESNNRIQWNYRVDDFSYFLRM
jgi:hypothetical protein